MNARVWFVTLVVGVLAPLATASPILIRHDRDDTAYLDLGRRYGVALCHVLGPEGQPRAEGTLIASRWVLTAAHVAQGVAPGHTILIGGKPYAAARAIVHPGWRGPEHDIGLIQLADPVSGVAPLPLYRGDGEVGHEIVVVGQGMTGTGLTGPTREDGRVRGATNRVEAVSDTWMRFTFDGPDADGVTDLEGISGPGDSGGPALLIDGSTVYVAGVSSGQDDAHTGGQPGRYGVVEYYTRVSRHADWIDRAMRAADTEIVEGELGEELDAYMKRLEHLGFSGGLLVAEDGGVVLLKGYGMADRAAGSPFTSETVFPVGSITKQFTGAAILKLEMAGQLRVEDPITTYFDGVPEDKAGITLHHLLTHSAGFPEALGFDFAGIEREDYVREALAADLAFVPGTAYAYSNVGYSLLAAIVEQVSGQTYDAFVHDHLFGPAGMTKTGYDLSRYAPNELAHGHRNDEDWGTFADQPWADDGPYWHLRGNGGILSTLGDMYRWHLALEDETVLSAAAKQRYYTPHVREGEDAPSFYGYGWVIQDTDRGRLIWHDGGNPYFSNEFRRYVDAGVVLYLTSNTGDFPAPRYMQDLAAIVFGDPYELPPEQIGELSKDDLAASPVGRRAQALLAMLAADEDAIRPFIDEQIASRLFEQYSADELAKGFASDQRRIGAVEVARIEQTGEHELALTVQSKASGQWRRLIMTVDPEPPHRLIGFGVEPAMPPAEPTGNSGQAVSSPAGGDWGLPDSPTGRAASAFLNAVTQADDVAYRRFVEQYFASDFRDQFSMDQHLAQFRRMHDALGEDVEVVGAGKAGPNAATIKVRSASGATFSVLLEVEAGAPHRIARLGMENEGASNGTPDGMAALDDSAIVDSLAAYLRDLADRDAYSGAVLLAKDGEVLFEQAYGMANKEKGLPNRIDTKFNMGSMNKMFTALAIAQLAEQGRLSFDDLIIKHLPDYPNEGVAEQVTIHHLLTHTSGLGFYPFDHGAKSPSDILPFFGDEPLAFEPGSRMQYSNAGFVVLGLIIEEVSGQSYYDYLREHIFEPAGMTNTGSYPHDVDVSNRAVGYTRMGEDGEESRGPRRPSTDLLEVRGSPAGGGYSTLHDMLRFGEALKDHTLLGPEMTEVLLTGKVEMGPGMRYAYGFGDHRRAGQRVVGHNGGAPGVGADFKLYLDTGYTAVVFTNYDPRVGMDISRTIQRLVIP